MPELPYDPKKAIRHIKKTDATLANVIDLIGPFQLKTESIGNPFRALVRAIVGQQLSTKAAAGIYNRLVALYGADKSLIAENVANTPEIELREVGLSWAKVRALKDLSEKTIKKMIPTRQKMNHMNNAQLIEALTQVSGIGPWTVEMILIFSLGRADVMPATDLGIRKGFQIVYRRQKLPEPKQILNFSKKWQPYRTIASWYLWRVTDQSQMNQK